MIEVPHGVPKYEFDRWVELHGIQLCSSILDKTNRASAWDTAWAVANWKDHQWRQKECEYIRIIDGLRCEIEELKNGPTDDDSAGVEII